MTHPNTITTADIHDALKRAAPIRRKPKPAPGSEPVLMTPAAHPGTELKPMTGRAEMVNLSDVQRGSVEWLWPGRFPLGKLCVLAGDPGLGKSFATMDLAARVSRGSAWPDSPNVPNPTGGVVLLSAEDDLGDTIRPRLDACGADVSRINALTGWRYDDSDRAVGVTLASLHALEDAIVNTPECRLVIIDPVTAYMGAIDAHRTDQVRDLLKPVGELAAKHRVTVLFVSHLNKGMGGNSLHRVTGSLALVAAARASWLVTADSADPERRLMLMSKLNVGRPAPGMAYTIGGEPAQVRWSAEPVNMTANDAMKQELGGGGEDGGGRTAEAAAWLRSMLADGPMAAKLIQERAKADGIKSRTLDRAKDELGILAERSGFGPDGGWSWRLPDDAIGP